MSLVFYLGYDNRLIYFSILFLLVVIANFLSLKVYTGKNITLKLILFTIIPSLAYLVFICIYGQNYFVRYKALISLPLIYQIIQILTYVKIGKTK